MKIALKGYMYLPKRDIPGVDRLRNQLVARSRYDREYCVYAYEDRQTSIGIPINFDSAILKRGTKIYDLRTDGQQFAIGLQSKLYDYQQDAFDEICREMESGATNFIIKARTGWGKTVLASALVSHLSRTLLIVVPVTTLVHQWREELLKHTDLTADDIGIATDAKVEWRGKKVVIGLVHTLVLDRWGSEFKKNFGAVIFDEVDRSAPPETFAPICTMFPARYRFAMSATTSRKDGLDKVFHWHFGEVYIDGNRYKNIRVQRSKALVIQYPKENMPYYLAKMSDKLRRRGVIMTALAKDMARNEMLCTYIKRFYNTKRPTLILSDRIDQLITLASIMERQYKVPAREMGFFIRSMPKDSCYRKTPQKKLPEKQLIFGTYKMLDIGFDMKELSGLVMATPRSSIEQTVGRIERYLEGKQQPVVVDVVDTTVKDAVNWSRARKTEYERLGIPVTERRHNG